MSTHKTSPTSILGIQDSILQLLHATGSWSVNRMQDKEDRLYYSMGHEACMAFIALPSSAVLDPELLVDRLMESKLQYRPKKRTWFFSATPRASYQLAHDHAIETVRSLAKRFVTGVSSDSKTVHRTVDVHSKLKAY